MTNIIFKVSAATISPGVNDNNLMTLQLLRFTYNKLHNML